MNDYPADYVDALQQHLDEQRVLLHHALPSLMRWQGVLHDVAKDDATIEEYERVRGVCQRIEAHLEGT